MTTLYPVLFYSGVGGGLLLLAMGSVPRLRMLCRPFAAFLFSLLACLWALAPQEGRWAFSVWSSATARGGQFIFDISPALWGGGLILGLVFAGIAWFEVSRRDRGLVVDGVLGVMALLVLWATLLSGSVLTLLAFWSVADLVWCVAGLISGEDGERVIFGVAVRGLTTLVVWGVSLYQLRDGTSELWWLMQPRESMLHLLYFAALIRVGPYPFQIVFPRDPEQSQILRLVQLTGMFSGVALLFRLLRLPMSSIPPAGYITWLIGSALWCGLMGLIIDGRRALLWVGYAVHLALIASVLKAGAADSMVWVLAGWAGAMALLMLYVGWERRAVFMAWPALVALLFVLGVPPSPIGGMLAGFLTQAGWANRLMLICALTLAAWAAFEALAVRTEARTMAPWVWLRVAAGAGVGLILGGLVGVSRLAPLSWPAPAGAALWLSSIVLGGIAAHWGGQARAWIQRRASWFSIIDLEWLYRALWQGAEHGLGLLRVASSVVEGSGALVWSLLIVLLVLLVAGRL